MNIILFGFKGSGKTTLGKKLAHRLNRPFIDTDDLIQQIYFQMTGESLSCPQIYKTLGEAGFRNLEAQAVASLKSAQKTVIAVGGGAILNPKNVTFLEKLGQLVYLRVSKATLKERVLRGAELPAYLDRDDLEGSFETMYNERKPRYEEIHALSLDLETKTQDQVILELSALIQGTESTNEEELYGQ